MNQKYIQDLQNEFPKAWAEFQEFYNQMYSDTSVNLIPFPFFFGTAFYFFREVAIELDINNTDTDLLPEVIKEAFMIHENNIAHFS
ncbi:MAG: hypothetical protein U0U66_05945 [Cytophagaceae bacterium]